MIKTLVILMAVVSATAGRTRTQHGMQQAGMESGGMMPSGKTSQSVTVFKGSNAEVRSSIMGFNALQQVVAPGTGTKINWDAGAVTGLTKGKTAMLPNDLFLANAPRHLICSEDSFATLPNGGHLAGNASPYSPNVTCGPSVE